jgi:nucleotide-binding universal stress UspA family protein
LLGFTLAAHGEACVFIVHVVAGDFVNHRPGINSRAMKQQMRIARQMVAESPELGDTQSVRIETGRPVGPSPEAVILDMAAQQDMDLIILGTALRTRFERLSLGPRVERILNNAPLLARWPLSTRLRPTLST